MKIVCFGDSVTRGISYVKGRLRIMKANYPTLLQQMLSSSLPTEVVNKGVFNDTSHSLIERLEKDVLLQQPDYVLIGIGGNDCNFHWAEVAERPEEAHEPIVPCERFLANIQALAQRVQQSNAIPLFLSLVPLDPKRYYRNLVELYGNKIAHWIALCGGIEHWHAEYDRALKKMVEALNLTLIDVRSAFQREDDLTELISDDGIHPTTQGYQMMSRYISEQLTDLFGAAKA